MREEVTDPVPEIEHQVAEITQSEEERIPLTDERAQREFDKELGFQALRQARGELSSAKLAYALAAAGVSGGMHLNQHRKAVQEKRKQVDVILDIVRMAEDGGIPEPSRLEIFNELPADDAPATITKHPA